MKWELHGGIWRCHPYKVSPIGKRWQARRQLPGSFPYVVQGSPFESEHDAMAACFDDAQRCAGKWVETDNREADMQLSGR